MMVMFKKKYRILAIENNSRYLLDDPRICILKREIPSSYLNKDICI